MDRASVRTRQRYWALIELGYDCRTAKNGANRIATFVALVTAKGQTVADYGDLGRRELGGKPRVDTPRSRTWKVRYERLRALGAGSAEASEASQIERTYRELETLLVADSAGDTIEP